MLSVADIKKVNEGFQDIVMCNNACVRTLYTKKDSCCLLTIILFIVCEINMLIFRVTGCTLYTFLHMTTTVRDQKSQVPITVPDSLSLCEYSFKIVFSSYCRLQLLITEVLLQDSVADY